MSKLKRPKKTASLREQQDYWYSKLKEEGFEDIEDPNTGLLKKWSSSIPWNKYNKQLGRLEDVDSEGDQFSSNNNRSRIEKLNGRKAYGSYSSEVSKVSTFEYYRLAGQFFYDHRFEDHTDLSVWWLHSEGSSVREIAAKTGLLHWKVASTIERLKKDMLKLYAVS